MFLVTKSNRIVYDVCLFVFFFRRTASFRHELLNNGRNKTRKFVSWFRIASPTACTADTRRVRFRKKFFFGPDTFRFRAWPKNVLTYTVMNKIIAPIFIAYLRRRYSGWSFLCILSYKPESKMLPFPIVLSFSIKKSTILIQALQHIYLYLCS